MRILRILIIAAALLNLGVSEAGAQTSFGKSSLFNDGWLFSKGDFEAASDLDFDDTRWKRTELPHDWSIEGPLSPANAACTGFLPAGTGWYRRHFDGRTAGSGKLYVYFEGVYNRSSVYLNGHLLGHRPSGYNSFIYDMTPYLDRDGENVIAVKVDHSRIADSRWYPGSGIYRNVWLVRSGPVHFSLWGVGCSATRLTDKSATVKVDAAIEGLGETSCMLKLELFDTSGKVVAESTRKASAKQNVELRLASPHRWDMDDPYQYTLKASIVSGKEILDCTEVKVGLRTLEFDADKGFALNGRNMKIKGVCLHHDAGVLGAVVPHEVWEKRLSTLKSLGVNAIRTSHNPQAPQFYDICDSLGLLVMDEAFDEWEFNKKKWVEGWNVGTPALDGTADYFEEWCERDVKDMVLRDRNHPCVFLWSIGNEVDYPNDPYSHPILDGDNSEFTQPISGGYKPDAPDAMRIGAVARRFAEYVHSTDPTRPVTGALAGVVMSNQTGYPEAVDVVGYNYTESRYAKDHAKYPGRILYGSENRHDYGSWKAVRDNEYIFGQFLWTGIDYLGEAGRWPSRGSSSGLLDLAGNVKPRGRYREALWSDKPVCYIGTSIKTSGPFPGRFDSYDIFDAPDVWNYEDGQIIRVVCYTNGARARLLLNGREVGAMADFNDETGIIGWDVPYAAGTLTAESYDTDGNKVAEYTIKSSLRPFALRASAGRTEVEAGGSVVMIDVDVLDENGTLVRLGDNEIRCDITGPARLLGLEGADNYDVSDYTDNVQRAYRGHLLAYIRTDDNPGDIEVRFTSPLLKGCSLTIHSHKYTDIDDIRLSDPFIFADARTQMYYMTGTGGLLWKSPDLEVWDGPFNVAVTDRESWMGPHPMIWAAEIHEYQGKYYYFATFTNRSEIIQEYRGNKINRRACHVLVGDRPDGPFYPMADETYLPADQPTLDASLWVEDGQPYLIFCHEWLQNWNGTVESIPLKSDLSGTEGVRNILFRAFDSPWSRERHEDGSVTPNKVTDGPYVFRTQTGRLGMIWTSWAFSDYTQGVAYSGSGKLAGPWIQMAEPVTPPNFGHGMIFTTLDGKRLLCCHSHEQAGFRTIRIPALFLVDDSTDELRVLGRYRPR